MEKKWLQDYGGWALFILVCCIIVFWSECDCDTKSPSSKSTDDGTLRRRPCTPPSSKSTDEGMLSTGNLISQYLNNRTDASKITDEDVLSILNITAQYLNKRTDAPKITDEDVLSALNRYRNNRTDASKSIDKGVLSGHTNRELATISFEELWDVVGNTEDFTDLQRAEFWKKYDGKYVRWRGEVRNVSEEIFGSDLVVDIRHLGGTMTSDVSLFVNNKHREKLLKLKDGDIIVYTGKLSYYGRLIGIQLKDGAILRIE